ncbi:MAG: hypothetical protein PUG48_07190 [Clostridia bacterium]|nr:hypothetical protein [Clostridia bacterium]
MSYTKKTISVSSDEKTFVRTFIEELTATDSRISCDTDIDAQFSDTSKAPQFTVNFGTNSKIVFTRNAALTSGSSTYIVRTFINNNQMSVSISFSSSNNSHTTIAVRTWKFIVAANENSLYIALGNQNSVMPGSAQISVVSISDGEFSAASMAQNASAISSKFYGTDTDNQNNAYEFANRLNYEATDGNIEIIRNKALLDSTKITKIRSFDGLCDCSTVTQYSLLKVGKETFYALNSNTVIVTDRGDV